MLIREQIGAEMCPGWGNVAIGEQIGPEMCPEWENVAIGYKQKELAMRLTLLYLSGRKN